MQITTVGLDLAKQTFHVVGLNRAGRVVLRKRLRRDQLPAYFAQLPPCTVAMEACAGAHHWGRTLAELGHTIQLLPAQHVKAYVRGQKNDYNDAIGIAEAALQGRLRTVPLKSVEQQALQTLMRSRQGVIATRTALVNRWRGLLAEFGIVCPRGVAAFRRGLSALVDAQNTALPAALCPVVYDAQQQLQELDAHLAALTRALNTAVKHHAGANRVQAIPGFGPITAAAFVSHFAQPQQFANGRQAAASVGLVPRQHTTGGRIKLGNITKRGDPYLRSLLAHGARAALTHAAHKTDALSAWSNALRARVGFNKATIALANKLTRIGWAVLAHDTPYQPR